MKRMRVSTAVIACALASTSAMAVDRVNKDSRKYEASFEDGPSTQRSSIHASTTQSGGRPINGAIHVSHVAKETRHE